MEDQPESNKTPRSCLTNIDLLAALLAHMVDGASLDDLAAQNRIGVGTLKRGVLRKARGCAANFMPAVTIRTVRDIERLKPVATEIENLRRDILEKEIARINEWNGRELDCLLPNKLRFALYGEGILTLEALAATSSDRLLLIPGIGRSMLPTIVRFLRERGGTPCPVDERWNHGTLPQ